MPFFFRLNVIPAFAGMTGCFENSTQICDTLPSTYFLTGPNEMKIVSAILGCILFVLFFGFALKNTDPVDLHFFLGYELRGPLVLMLLAFFIAGAFLGILAVTPTVFRHRRESSQHKNTIQALQSAAGTAASAPQPDSVTPR
jgi:uncharacterized integral membrane protein